MCSLVGGILCMCLKGFLLGPKRVAFSGVMSWCCEESLHCSGGELNQCVFVFFFVFLVSLERQNFLPVSWVCAAQCLQLAICTGPISLAEFTSVVGDSIDFMYRTWNICHFFGGQDHYNCCCTKMLRPSYFSPLYLNLLKQPNMQIFLEDLGRRIEKIACHSNEWNG